MRHLFIAAMCSRFAVMSTTAAYEPVIAYYDALCPLCRKEMGHYHKRAPEMIIMQDCNGNDLPADVDRDAALASLHVRLPDGRLVDGWDAFIAIWERTPGFGWLAAVNRPWIIRKPLDWIYRRLAPLRPRDKCRDGVCEV